MAVDRSSLLRDEVGHLAAAGLDWKQFSQRAVGRVARAVGCDVWCVATADPSTLLMTGITGDGELGPASRFFELEYGIEDYLSQDSLARGPVRVDALSRVTDGRLDRSERWRELLQPSGLGDQLRAALVSGDRCWGFLSMMRDRSRASFSPADLRLVWRTGAAIADGLRRANLLSNGTREQGTGVVLLDERLEVVEGSSVAEDLLAEARVGIVAVATRASVSGTECSSTIRTSSGWTRLVAIPLRADGERTRIAVICQPPDAEETLALTMGAYGFTPREAELSRHVVAGRSTREIGDLMQISTFTVQQHLKSIFEKAGVRSRRQLAGLVFEQLYLPRMS